MPRLALKLVGVRALLMQRMRKSIDRSRLSPSERDKHDHATRVITMMADAQRRERQKAERLFRLAPLRSV